jgi:kinesin family protein 6/9
MLKDSIGGNCKTTMVANVWPEANKLEETASTLRFATRMMRVSNEATVNVHLDPALLIRKYERQIKDLKQELAMHDTLAGRSRVQYEEYSPDEQAVLETKVQMYLDGEIQEIEVQSLRMYMRLLVSSGSYIRISGRSWQAVQRSLTSSRMRRLRAVRRLLHQSSKEMQ